MSTYTTQVRYICETYAGLEESVGYSRVSEVIDKAAPKVFDFEWDVFDEAYRPVLMRKILKHYYTKEIGFETVGLWKLKLDERLNEVMPYFNLLYKSAALEINPLYDVDLTTERTIDGTMVGNEKGRRDRDNAQVRDTDTEVSANVVDSASSSRDGNEVRSDDSVHWNLFQDTPQNTLSGIVNLDHLSDARKETDEGTQTTRSNDTASSNATSRTDSRTGVDESVTTTETVNENKDTAAKTTEEYVQHVFGKNSSKSYSQMIQEWRDTFLNIDAMVVDSLSDLFMTIW